MKEIFKPSGYDGYEVSNFGRIKRILGGQGFRAGRCLSPHKSSGGYLFIRLTVNGHQKSVCVHKLVTEIFLGKRPIGLQVRHLDGNKENNRIDNLVYGTAKENGADNTRLGVMPRGEKVNTNVITTKQAKLCFELLKNELSATEIAKVLKIPRNTVYKIKYGKTWKWLPEGKVTL